MRVTCTTDGGLRLELEPGETELFRRLVERAAFIDTPPDRQHEVLRLAEAILAALGERAGA
ncbi:MAG: hypothetical protein HY509_03455 [Acidobacteria bacterium]|nr:hypothetical protein [Acidobacteriota bacterium]